VSAAATTPVPTSDRAAKARAEHQRRSAHRAVDDPVKLARAARIVCAALERQRLTLDDLRGDVAGPVPATGDPAA